MRKDSFVETVDEMSRKEENKGIMVTIFVITCMVIIVTIGVVALILKGKQMLVYILISFVSYTEPSVCNHPSKPRRGWLKFNEEFNGIIKNDTVVEYSCDKGWTLEGPEVKKCLDSGLWEPEEKAKCLKIV